ncbi:hypothetical protein COLO4_09986 [Corchorus olitorius]|uniref:Protein kinase domain-containing protein n=1 Tax=Corchorus olitorius TaxID=93759 RepID=A0A1R3KAE5_9ROSI|nr:hypothetical protein COLO4_09986 [Corchorus olitorius]
MAKTEHRRFDCMKKAWLSLLRKKTTKHRVLMDGSQLKMISNEFGKENLVTKTHFGKLYRGEIPHGMDESTGRPRRVTVKIWQHLQWGFPSFGKPNGYVVDKKSKLMNEVYFLSHPSVRNHPNLVKLIGYCCDEDEGLYAVVYDLDPLNTLHNLITKVFSYFSGKVLMILSTTLVVTQESDLIHHYHDYVCILLYSFIFKHPEVFKLSS